MRLCGTCSLDTYGGTGNTSRAKSRNLHVCIVSVAGEATASAYMDACGLHQHPYACGTGPTE